MKPIRVLPYILISITTIFLAGYLNLNPAIGDPEPQEGIIDGGVAAINPHLFSSGPAALFPLTIQKPDAAEKANTGARNGGKSSRNSFRPNPAPVNIVNLDMGFNHTCATTDGGVVKCWGANSSYQLGDGTNQIRLTPVNAGLAEGIKQVATGGSGTCVLTETGGVKCWGASGLLGDGTIPPPYYRAAPVDVVGLSSGVKVLTAGSNHVCALLDDGGVKCWGSNEFGQLGDGSTQNRYTPVDVPGLGGGVLAIEAGGYHTCAITFIGGIKCWGRNGGALGDGTSVNRSTPVDVIGFAGVAIDLSAGVSHTCAVKGDGGVMCWGSNLYGKIGSSDGESHSTAVNVDGITSGATAVSAGSDHTCAIVSGGVKCWGRNVSGAVGDGTYNNFRLKPVDVAGLEGSAVGITAGEQSTCAMTSNGGAMCWGWNQGRLGDGTTADRYTPVRVLGLGMKKWTVMVYMGGDDDLEDGIERNALDNFNEMAEVGSGINLNMLVQLDRIPGYDSRYGDWTNTRRFYVTRGMEPTSANGSSIGEKNTGDPAVLTAFIQWSMESYPAEHYFLILYGHGNGIEVVSDSTNDDKLTIWELQSVLEFVTNNGLQPFDLIGLDACVMANIETATQLIHNAGDEPASRPYAKILIASEDVSKLTPGLPNGFNYHFIMQELENTPGKPLDELVEGFVNKYHSQLWAYTQSAVDLGRPYDELLLKVKTLAAALIAEGYTDPVQIKNARFGAIEFGLEGSFIDLFDFAQQLFVNVDNENIVEAAYAVMTAIGDGDCEPDTLYETVICQAYDATHYSGHVPHGISIYFPRTQAGYNSSYDGTQGLLQFTAITEWDEFLHEFYAIPESSAVSLTVMNTDNVPEPGLTVYVFKDSTYANVSEKTDVNGQVTFTLPEGSYRFRADKNGTQFWSGANNHCDVPGCTSATITTTIPMIVTVLDPNGTPEVGLTVYAFNGSTYTNYSKKTDANGQAAFTLPAGSYRFRADKNGTQFWSGAGNHCDVPGCTSVSITTTNPLVVTVLDSNGTPEAGLTVYAFNGSTYTNYSKKTDANGQATFTLPAGSYRFRADKNGTQFWSGAGNHCDVPGCTSATITTTIPMIVTVLDPNGTPEVGLTVYAFNGSTYTNYSKKTDANGQAAFTLPAGSYRFRADKNGTQFWSGAGNHCDVPGCTSATITTTIPMIVTVLDPNGIPEVGLTVYAFNGSTYTNYSKKTDANGQAAFTLPVGSYRFRADKNGTQFWSGANNHCDVPGCTSVSITTTNPLVVTVLDSNGTPEAGLTVYAFNGSTYTNYSKKTDANGQAAFTLPEGSYRFRVDKNGTQFWSGSDNHCTIPGCTEVIVRIETQQSTTTPTPTETPEPSGTPTPFDTPTPADTPVLSGQSGSELIFPFGGYLLSESEKWARFRDRRSELLFSEM